MMQRSPGPNTPEFVDYYAVAERSIHKPMQPWAGVQMGNEFWQKLSNGVSTKHSTLGNLQVIDPPTSTPQIINCFDYEHFENVTGDRNTND